MAEAEQVRDLRLEADDMNAVSVEPSDDLSLLPGEPWAAAAHVQDRKFWLALGAAAIVHALFFIGAGTTTPKRAGEIGGAEDAISISVITEADLKSRMAVPEAADAAPGAAAAAATPPPPPPPPPQPETPNPDPKVEPADAIRQSITEDVPDVLSIPGPGEAPAKKTPAAKPQPQTKPQPPQPKPQRSAKLDLSPPAPSFNPPPGGGGRSAGFERPPGITRSGANDDFARGVIRALQQSMPQLRDTLGRVTVRITLNDNGNVVDVQVIKPARLAGLDQSVVFAAKQTSYPLPPPNSNDADRTFLVTYIYE